MQDLAASGWRKVKVFCADIGEAPNLHDCYVAAWPEAVVRLTDGFTYREVQGEIEVLDTFTRNRYGVHPGIMYRFIPREEEADA